MLLVTDIQWVNTAVSVHDSRCPICGTVGKHKELLTIPHMWTGSRLTLYECNSCGTRFYPNAVESSYDEANVASEMFLQHYLEAGAGHWEMLWPIGRFFSPLKSRLLDVGCGYGFSVDMWKNIFNAEAIGVETAEWGQIGSAKLGITVHRGMLDEITPLQGKDFDIVYACEVIEHVSEPLAFLKSLSKRVSKEGILALTTPSGDFIREGNDEKDILAALLPGGHLFLLSAKAFENLLRQAGFPYVHVIGARERLIAYASHSPIDLNWSEDELRTRYITYLKTRLSSENPGTPFHDGFAYRLFKELVANGYLDEAQNVVKTLRESLELRFGSDQDPNSWICRSTSVAGFEDWGKQLPFFIGSYCFFRGELARLAEKNLAVSLEWYKASLEITLRSINVSPLFFTEAIYLMWDAINRSILLHLLGNNLIDALNSFELISSARSGKNNDFGGVKPELESVLEGSLRLLPHVLNDSNEEILRRFNEAVERSLKTPYTDIKSAHILSLLANITNLLLRYKEGHSANAEDDGKTVTEALSELNAAKLGATDLIQELLKDAINVLKPSIVLELFKLGVAKHQQKFFTEAEQLYKIVISLDEAHLDALNNLAIVSLLHNRVEEAFDILRESLRIDPDQPDVLNTYGSMLFDRELLLESLQSFDNAIALQPDYAEAYNNRGIVLFSMGRKEEALRSFEKAMSLKPEYEEAKHNRIRALQDMTSS